MPRKTKSSNAATVVVFLIIGLLAAAYVFAGLDPIGLFTEEETALQGSIPTPSAVSTAVATSGATSGSGDWWKVFFTDPAKINNPDNLKGSVTEKLIAYINGAQTSIDIAAFEFNLTPVADALIAAHQRGVKVRWVTDDEYGLEADEEDDHGQFAMLEKAGIEIRDDGRTALMHDKFWIFDSHIVWTGSTNATINDHFRNNNNVIVIDSPELAAIYEQEFADMWEGQFGPNSPSDLAAQKLTVKRTPVQVLFSPEDDVIDQLIPLIESAQTSIHFMAFSYTHDALMHAMLERAEAGVDVTGIFENRASETEYSALPPMYCAELAVRQDGNPGTFHHKVIVIDGKIVVTGSLNFSDNADQSNSENTIVITSVSIAKLYEQEFQRRWAEAVVPDPAQMNCK